MNRIALATCCCLLATGAAAWTSAAAAENYPIRPVRLVIPYSAGGATDVVTEEGVVEVYTEPQDLHRVQEELSGAGYEIAKWSGNGSTTAFDVLAGARYWNEETNLSLSVSGDLIADRIDRIERQHRLHARRRDQDALPDDR